MKAVRANHWAKGGEGALEVAEELLRLTEGPKPTLAFTYPSDLPLWEKVRAVARKIYGAADLTGDPKVRKAFQDLEAAGFGHLPVCLAKTQYSFSTDPTLRGRPEGFTLPVRDVRVSAGAGFVVVLTGDIMTMPGLRKSLPRSSSTSTSSATSQACPDGSTGVPVPDGRILLPHPWTCRMTEISEPLPRFGMRMEQFSDLMPYRVFEILLVATNYDAFILEEDGQLTELMGQEIRNLGVNLRGSPRFAKAESGREALALLTEKPFDMVVTTARLPDLAIATFAREAKALVPGLPVGVLAVHAWEVPPLEDLRTSGAVDWVFLWLGDVKSLFAMIKQQEDHRNADHDVLERGRARHHRRGGRRPVLLLPPALHLRGGHHPDQPPHGGGAQPLPPDPAHPRAAQDPPGPDLRGGLGALRALRGEPAGHHLRRGLPPGGRPGPGGGTGAGPPGAPAGAGPADPPAVLGPRQPRAGQELGAVFLHKDPPPSWPTCAPSCWRTSASATSSSACRTAPRWAGPRTCASCLAQLEKVPDVAPGVPRQPRPLLPVVRRAHRIHAGRRGQAGDGRPVPHPGRAPRPPARHAPGLHPRSPADHHLGLRRRDFDEFVTFAKVGSGSLGGKGRGLAFMQKLLAQEDLSFPGMEVAIPRTLAVASDVFEGFLERNGLSGMPHDCPDSPTRRSSTPSAGAASTAACGASWPSSSRWCARPWRCAPPASWRIRSTSPSPESTQPSCSPTATPASTCAWRSSWRP